jgi:hypothetical protein
MPRRRLRRPRPIAAIRGREHGPEPRLGSLLVLVMLLMAVAAVAPIALAASRTPVLTVRAETLKWTAVGKRHVYRVLTRAPGKQTISTVVARTLTPPAVPGATVTYLVKAAYGESPHRPKKKNLRLRRRLLLHLRLRLRLRTKNRAG